MPSIRVSDELNIEIISAESGPGSGISKYLKGDTAGFLASSELALAANKPLATLPTGAMGFGLKFAADGAFGTSAVDWKVKASSPVTVDITQAGEAVPGDKLFLNPIVVPAGRSALTVSFAPTLSASVGTDAGDLRFGFEAGGSVMFRAGRFFESAVAPTLGVALKELLQSAIVPGNVIDLQQMREADFSSVGGTGTLKLSGSFDVQSAINPLVTPTLGLKQIGSVRLDAGASLEVGASVEIRGSYQMRVQKSGPNQVRLAYYKMAGSRFEFDVTAKAGVEATLNKVELIERLMGMMGKPKADVPGLVDAGLSDQQIEGLKSAIEESLSRSIAISLAGSFASSKTETKIFEYIFELDKLGHEGIDALQHALRADLTALTARPANALPAGVRLVQSEFEQVRSRKTVWKINLLGVVNVLDLHELVRSGKALFNADTGELVVTDSVTAKDIAVSTRPLEADNQKLRTLMLKSFVATAAVRASGLHRLLSFSGSMSYFEQVGAAKRQIISDFLDNLVAALLITQDEKKEFLKDNFFGRASVFLDLTLGDADFQSLFFDPDGKPHNTEHFDKIARMCMGFLVQPGDENDFRRAFLESTAESDRLWKEMRSAGPAALQTVLPDRLNEGQPLAAIRHDYIVMSWWSDAMANAAGPVTEMRQFLKSSTLTPEQLQIDATFRAKREKITKVLAAIANTAVPDFVDAWGILAMYTAARRMASIRGILLTTGAVLVKSRQGGNRA